MTTNPTGVSFLSYRRARLGEAEILVAHQRDLGIPTWQDISDLAEDPTEDTLREVLRDPGTANAVMWLTPEVAESEIIRQVEAPLILERAREPDGFFSVPVAAGGLSYKGAAKVLEGGIGIDDLRLWNIRKIDSDPANESEIRALASRVLARRLQHIERSLASDEPLRIVFNTRADYGPAGDTGLKIDWLHRFEGRLATAETWNDHLIPSLLEISDRIGSEMSDRPVSATGSLSLPAATALGWAFLAPKRIKISWDQYTPGHPEQTWSLTDPRSDSGFETVVEAGFPSADDMAVMVSVNADVSRAVGESRSVLPKFRAMAHIRPVGNRRDDRNAFLRSPGQAVDVAWRVVEGARKARAEYLVRGKMHLFMAVPSGLAMLIGQLLNTLGQVQTYEHVQDGATGRYVPAALLGEQPEPES